MGSRVTLLLWDVGGVLLSNGWDHASRAAAVEKFGLDGPEFERRHAEVEVAFERGALDWDGYLAKTVFYQPRAFSPGEFRAFVESRSAANPENLTLVRGLRARGEWTMATLNNESRELNDYRVRVFGLRDLFDVFFSSGSTGRRKPEPDAYRFALELTQRAPDEAIFIDDRPENVATAANLGLGTVLARSPDQIRSDLASAGVAAT
jgi:putative hydrolase of the HAD superfamily